MLDLVPLVSIVERVKDDITLMNMITGGNSEYEERGVKLISTFIEGCYNRKLLDEDIDRRTQYYLIRAVINELHPDLRQHLIDNYYIDGWRISSDISRTENNG